MDLHQSLSMPIVEEQIGSGDTAILKTIDRMRDIIHRSSANPYVRHWAQRVLGQVTVNDKWGEAAAVHNFVRDNIRYTRDPRGIEFIQTPPVLLEGIKQYMDGSSTSRPIGDCDDMTTLSLSLMKSIGFDTAIKVVSFKPNGKFSHVYGMVNIEGEWTSTDSVRTNQYLGWEASGTTRVHELEV